MDKTYIITEEEMQVLLHDYINHCLLINAGRNKRIPSKEELDLHLIGNDKIVTFFTKYNVTISNNDEWPNTRDKQWKALW